MIKIFSILTSMKIEFEKGKDYYFDSGRIILTENYLKNRGFCCGSKCRHCVFDPSYQKGNTNLKKHLKNK